MKEHPKETRTCIACRKKMNKYELYRFCFIGESVLFDEKYTLGGKGLYICKDISCVNKLIDKKLLNKIFKKKVSINIYQEMKNALTDKKE